MSRSVLARERVAHSAIRGQGRSCSPLLYTVLLSLALTACSTTDYGTRDSAPSRPKDVSHVQDAVPRVEPKSRYGNPQSYVVYGKRYYPMSSSTGYRETGGASWYGTKFHGRRTSSGEPYDMYQMTAAHKTLPLPTYVEVTNLDNGRRVVVRVNDRGPFHSDRIIDMSYAGAVKLGMLGKGTARVEVRAIDPRAPERQPAPGTGTRMATAAPAPPAHTPAVQPVTTPVTAGDANYRQVGAFYDRANAERMQREISSHGGSAARIEETVTGNGTLYRVLAAPGTAAAQVAQASGDVADAIFLQVGAFSSRANAEKMQRSIEDQDLGSVRIVETATANGTFYKVQVGPLAGNDEADRIARELKPLGVHERSIIR